MPCSDEDSKDIAYIRTIFNYLESRPENFDMTRVYAAGFSQNSMFSAYIGYCFPDNVVGVYQGKMTFLIDFRIRSKKLNNPTNNNSYI